MADAGGTKGEDELDFSQKETRTRSKLAIERTFAAWIRTGIAVMLIGIGIARFIVGRDDPMRTQFTLVGIAYVVAGFFLHWFALYDYYRAREKLEDLEYTLPKKWILGITLMLAGLTSILLLLFVYRAYFM